MKKIVKFEFFKTDLHIMRHHKNVWKDLQSEPIRAQYEVQYSSKIKINRDLMQQDSWKTQDGKMT